jgi:tetratricopeptide (TPR) repeat protein
LTEAYLVLSDPARAAEYRRGGGVVPMLEPAGGEAADRQAERAELARECYRAALDYVEAEDYFYAIEMLRQALLNNRRPEYYTLLGHCQMQNPRWLHLAVDSFRRALAMSPDDEQLRLQFADALELYRRQGDLPPATGGDRESRDARRARRAVARLQASRK